MDDECDNMLNTAFETFDPTSPLTTNDEDEVRGHFESNLRKTFWDNPPRSTINRPTLLREIRRINFKIKHTRLKSILKAEKHFRTDIASSIKYYAKATVRDIDVSKPKKINPTFLPLLRVMLLLHYEEIKKNPVFGRDRSNHLSPLECQTLISNIFIRKLILLWIKSSSKLPVTLDTCWPHKARTFPNMKKLDFVSVVE